MNHSAGVINCAVYEDGSEYLGMARVTMPDSTNKTFTLNGAGIPGDVDIPVMGHKDAMHATFEFIDSGLGAHKLSEDRRHLIDLRVAHEGFDATAGRLTVSGHKYVMTFVPITRSGGELAPATAQSRTVEGSVLAIKEFIDGKLVQDFDPLNFKNIDATGKDALADVRRALGK